MGLLDDKVAIITGAGAALGGAVARLFAAEGASLVLSEPAPGGATGRVGSPEAGAAPPALLPVAEAIQAAGGRVVTSTAAPTTAAGAAALVAEAETQWGGVDILVNGVALPADGGLLTMAEAAWVAVVDDHLRAAFLALQAVARHMVTQGRGGRIVNTTSLASLRGQAGRAHLATAQAGIYGLTRVAAIELQRDQITVNAVAPVLAATEGAARQAELDSLGDLTPDHVAPAVLMLASDLCGQRTGRALGLCGSRVYSLELVESRGQLKDQNAPWTAAEIADHWDGICK